MAIPDHLRRFRLLSVPGDDAAPDPHAGALRFAPLAMGAFPFLAIFPILAATGERPPDMVLACWGATMLAVGLAMASLAKVEP